MEHDVVPLGERHAPHNFEYADEAERLAAVVTDAKWLQSLALQLDNGSYWRVTGVSPATWEQVVTAWVDIPGKPTEFPPEAHTHVISEVVDLQDELDAKEPSLGFTPEDSANKSLNLAADSTSDTKYPSVKAVFDAIANAVTGLFDFKGSTDASVNPNYPAALKGDSYVVSVAGKIGGVSGVSVDIGDTFFANADNAGGTQASVGNSWTVLEHNLAGALLASNNLSDIANAATSRANLGLGNVDNTSDANKPVSTAQATADTAVQTAAATDATTKANAAQAAALAASAPVAHVGAGGAAHANVVAAGAAGFMTGADKTKLDAITGANSGDETGARIATLHHAASTKSALVDADEVTGGDSAAGFGLIRTTWGSVKAFLKTYFDSLYLGISATAANASQLLGSTWAAPAAIGATTPAAANFTTLGATGTVTIGGATLWINTNKTLIQHDGSNGYIRAQVGTLFLGANGSSSLALDASGNVLVIGPAGLGYGAGAGGTVTQATSRTTGVTLSKPTGKITLFSTTTTAGTFASFTLTNTLIAATDVVIVNFASATSANKYSMFVTAVAAGSCRIQVYNIAAVAVAEAPVINFCVLKGEVA